MYHLSVPMTENKKTEQERKKKNNNDKMKEYLETLTFNNLNNTPLHMYSFNFLIGSIFLTVQCTYCTK